MSYKPILVIYTGGTIGSRPRDPDPDSPQVVVPWDAFRDSIPEVKKLGFELCAVSTPKPLDSCNIGPDEWRFMVEAIEKDYDKYAGFVILHGTDTMVYTASALSFMLRNLSKPVVLTGAQKSAMVDVRNDAVQNFITAAMLANPEYTRIPTIPEVVICFGGLILRGNRAVKRDTSGYTAYETPNLNPLGEAGESIVIDQSLILPTPTGRFNARKSLDSNVLPILIYPGIQDTDLVDRQLQDPSIKAAVVQSFGSGNIPTKPSFLNVFEKARARGIVVANVSQCNRGPVTLGIYETSAALLEAGFVSGDDMTKEAAQTKLMVLLGDPDLQDPGMDPAERQQIVERQFERSMVGEQSTSIHLTNFGEKSGGELHSDEKPGALSRIRGAQVEGQFDSLHVVRALLRLRGASLGVPDGSNDAIQFRVFTNLASESDLNESDPGFCGTFQKYLGDDAATLMVFDVTRAFRATVRSGDRVAYSIVLDSPHATLSWERAELAVFVSGNTA